MTTSILTVAGTAYPPTGATSRASARIALDRLVRSIDEGGTLEFHQYGVTLPALFHPGQSVALSIGGTPVFTGEVSRADPQFGPAGYTVGYSCQDALTVATRTVPVTNPDDSTGVWTFNLPSTDPFYVPAWAGQSVGGILSLLLGNHATALAAAGVAGYVPGDLTGLTTVPPDPVTIQGVSLLNAVRGFLDEWAGNVAMYFEWQTGTSDWRLRFKDPATFAPATLTLGTDPIDPPSISRDASQSYSRVLVRGKAIVESWFGSTLDGTLTPAWTSTGAGNQQSLWTIDAWQNPVNASDRGTITALTSTSATIVSASGTTHWVTNFWATNQGQMYLINPVSTLVTQMETRHTTANTALTAGGSSVITLDYALVNGGYTNYRLVCQPNGSEIDVWRRYNINNSAVAAHLLTSFPQPVAYANMGAITTTNYPVAAVTYGAVTLPAQFEIDPVHGQIRFIQPVVLAGNSDAQLAAGGASVTAPDDVWVLLAYGRGTLSSVAPASSFAGTSFTVDGISRTLTLDLPQWTRAGDQAAYDAYAAMKLKTVQDTVITGTVTYNGLYAAGLTLGQQLNVAGTGYTTGWESINAPVRSVVLQWPPGGAVPFVTSMSLSNRRKQATGDNYYIHPQFTGGSSFEGGQMSLGSQEEQAYAGLAGIGLSMTDPEWKDKAKAAIDAKTPQGGGMGGGYDEGGGDYGGPGVSMPLVSHVPVSRMGQGGNQAPAPAPPPPPPATQADVAANNAFLDAHADDIWGPSDAE